MAEIQQSNKVYNFVLEQIKSNKWSAGEKIYTEKELCEELEVSRIAVREALEQCSALGILEKRKGAGTYVSEIDISNILKNIVPLMTLKPMELMEVLRFRLHFEPGNIIEFMKHTDEKDIVELENTYKKMQEKALENKDFYTADYEFHKIIAKGTKNSIIISINEMLTGVLVASQEMTNLKIGPEIGLHYHKEIIEAIKNNDSEMAALLMTRHIEATIKCIEDANACQIESQSA
ncbi:MAG TPA: FCD domain-containing protein [Bacillota bacterium]|nr:FCD domain-containing protein [Bacillota bacterium]